MDYCQNSTRNACIMGVIGDIHLLCSLRDVLRAIFWLCYKYKYIQVGYTYIRVGFGAQIHLLNIKIISCKDIQFGNPIRTYMGYRLET